MNRKNALFLALALISTVSLVAVAGDLKGHPHLKAAHGRIDNALKDLKEANDGKFEFGGHREKAEDALKLAQKEIEEAAEWANSHKK